MVGALADARGERAQLILVGAIALAFLIFGIVVVFNSAVYTQTAGQDGTIERSGEPPAVEAELEAGVREVVQSTNRPINESAENESDDDVESWVAGNLTAFANHSLAATGESRPVLVALEDVETHANGTLVHEGGADNLSDGDTGVAFNGTAGTSYDVERFSLTVNTSTFESVGIGLDDHRIDIERDVDTLVVEDHENRCEIDLDPAADLPPGDDNVTVDLLTGEIAGDDRDIEECLADLLDEPSVEEVAFEDGVEAEGGFELVVGADRQDVDSDFAYRTAVTGVDSVLRYESDELTYDREIEIDVYGDRS